MTKLQEWLKELGLQQYAAVFADNDIDFDILSDLAESDLEKLGLSLGHRRKLLRALAALQPASSQPQTATLSEAPPITTEAQAAERRQVTVLFSDLVGSTALANAIDPEEMSTLIQRYQDACAGAIAQFDGFIAKFMGDGVLAYFGYPQGQEDAAERSVYAALALINSVMQLKGPDKQPLETRVGISTGVVVIGDIIGSGAAREHAIVGETPNLAARLQTLAEPNSILVSQSTHHLLGRQFDYQSLGERTLKGFANPVQVWRVLREAAVASRFAAGHAARTGPFIGRVQEIGLLLDRWQLAKQGEGQVIFLSGEAGMGKSRIVDALCERIVDDHYYHLICQCSPYHTNSALHPVIGQFERSAGFTLGDSAAIKLEKLETLLSATDNLSDSTRSLFADLLSIPLDDRYPPLDLAPAQRKAATIAAIVQQLTRLAEQKPVLFVLEDAHWIDPSTQELVTRVIDGIASMRVLALITARPEFLSPWTGRDHVTSLALSRLSKTQCAELIAGVATAGVLRPALVEDIVVKTDGVPLFIEELTKAIMESATPDRPAVPATLQDSLMARLDRLGPAKEIAQVAAVIGQQFSYALLETVSSASASDVATGIARLVEAGLAFPQSQATEPSYSFKHALMRDVAYDNLLRGRRQQIHQRVARALEEHFPAVAESEPEVLAQHFAQARLAELACTYYERAGDRAVARSNFAEAVAHLSAGLTEAGQLEESPDRSRRELALLLKLGPAFAIMKGPQSPEVEEVYERAHRIGTTLSDECGLFRATWGLWFSALLGRKLEHARDRAQELVALAQHSTDPDLLVEALHCRWATASFRGEVAIALKDSREGVERYNPARHSWMGPVFGGHDPGVCAHCVQAQTLCLSGFIHEGKECLDRGLCLAEKLKHPHSLALALQVGMVVHQLTGDHEAVDRLAQRLIELSDKYNFPPQRAHALVLSGWARAVGQDSEAGLELIEAEFPRASAIGPFFRYYGALLAEARAKFGKFSDALAVLRWAIETVTEAGVGLYVPELYRLQGVCLLRLDSHHEEEAMTSLQMAVHIAKQQKAVLFQLKAAISMAAAARSIGQPERGLQPLQDLCANLPEGFDVPELAEAKRLLSS
jgi:class 3 adenylate cyclase/tetratricopeptide (TPR) repeat protein